MPQPAPTENSSPLDPPDSSFNEGLWVKFGGNHPAPEPNPWTILSGGDNDTTETSKNSTVVSNELIQEIHRGVDINDNKYYKFLLSDGTHILLSGEELAGGLKLLERALATKGFMLTRQDKRNILEQLNQVKRENRFFIANKTGWYGQAYITQTKVYGTPSLPIFLYPAR